MLMLATYITTEEMLEESRKLINSLKGRIANIEGLGESAPQYAVKHFRELEKRIPKKLTDLSDKELRTLYRDLRYINALKSSTVKGAKEIQKKFLPIEKQLNALSKTTRNKFWEAYGKIFESTGGVLEKFKYEILETNIDYIYGGDVDIDSIVNDIVSAYDKTLLELGYDPDDETIKLHFTDKLDKLRKQFR